MSYCNTKMGYILPKPNTEKGKVKRKGKEDEEEQVQSASITTSMYSSSRCDKQGKKDTWLGLTHMNFGV